MCAGCPGGRPVSAAAAYVNAHRLTPRVLAALRRRVRGRAAVAVVAGQWTVRSRTGAQRVFGDLEHLVRALLDDGLIDDARMRTSTGAEMVEALLAGPGG